MKISVSLAVNGKPVSAEVESRTLLVEFLRERLQLTGTHVGCDTAQCGACTVLVDGVAAFSCLVSAAAAQGRQVTTVEGLQPAPGELSVLQDAFCETHALQCGFCTSGMLIAAHALLGRTLEPTRDDIVEAIGGNLCRCTGYQQIVEAVELAAQRLRAANRPQPPRDPR